MIFTPDYTAAESQDGKTITFTNTSNFDTNDQGFTRASFTTNKLVLKDAFGSEVESIDFPITGPNIDKIKFQISSSKWIEGELVMAGPTDYSKIKKFPFYRIFIQKYKAILKNGEGDPAINKDFDLATHFKDIAEYAIPIGDSVEFQENIDVAHAYLKQCL